MYIIWFSLRGNLRWSKCLFSHCLLRKQGKTWTVGSYIEENEVSMVSSAPSSPVTDSYKRWQCVAVTSLFLFCVMNMNGVDSTKYHFWYFPYVKQCFLNVSIHQNQQRACKNTADWAPPQGPWVPRSGMMPKRCC